MGNSTYRYSSRWKKLSDWLCNPASLGCYVNIGDEVLIVLTDEQLVSITGSSDSSEPLPLGKGMYSITERANAAGFTVGTLDDSSVGMRIKVFRKKIH